VVVYSDGSGQIQRGDILSRRSERVKVLVIDDSALIRALLNEILGSSPDIDVVGVACDPYEAREMIKKLSPDVLTLDIEMPKMNGIAFLKNLMRLRPMPVVMISTLTQEGAPETLEALEIGAVDFVPKPRQDSTGALEKYSEVIIEKVLGASRANIQAFVDRPSFVEGSGFSTEEADSALLSGKSGKKVRREFICAIGASTGGTEAIKEVVQSLPADAPPIVITQHIPATFSESFARRVDSISKVSVCEAQHRQKIEYGCVYIAPGHSHLRVINKNGSYYCVLDTEEPVNRHRPSVDVLFDSVREAAGKYAMGILLTGMGADGAAGLARMKEAGSETVAQDEASSIVWGMPGAAVKMGAASKVLPLSKISRYLLSHALKV